MEPITDFDPLKLLEDLQTGFLTLAGAQRILNENQEIVVAQIRTLWTVIERQQAQIDLLAHHIGLSEDQTKKATHK